NQRSGRTVDFQLVASGVRVDAAELEHALRAVGEMTKHRKCIRNDYVVTVSVRIQNFSPRKQAVDVAEPAMQHFDVNPQRHDVESANLDALSPVCWRTRVQIIAMKTLQPDTVNLPEKIFGQQFFHKQITA